MAGAEEDRVVICAALQLFPHQLHQFILHITAGDAVSIHTGKLILLVNHIVNCVGKVGVVHPVQNHINYQPLAILALSLGFRHNTEGNQFDLLLGDGRNLRLRGDGLLNDRLLHSRGLFFRHIGRNISFLGRLDAVYDHGFVCIRRFIGGSHLRFPRKGYAGQRHHHDQQGTYQFLHGSALTGSGG